MSSSSSSSTTSTTTTATLTKGIDRERFLMPVHEQLICGLCKKVMCEPHRCECTSDHTFCKLCLDDYLTANHKCPTCGEAISTPAKPCRIARNLINSIPVKCASGCGWEGTYEKCIDHEQECSLVEIPCTNAECKQKIARKDMKAHLEICAFTPIPCPQCEEKVQRTKLPAHMPECSMRLAPCPKGCGKLTPYKWTQNGKHAEECGLEMVTCLVPGCNEKMLRNQLPGHIESNIGRHMVFLMTSILIKDKEIKKLLEDVKKFKTDLNTLKNGGVVESPASSTSSSGGATAATANLNKSHKTLVLALPTNAVIGPTSTAVLSPPGPGPVFILQSHMTDNWNSYYGFMFTVNCKHPSGVRILRVLWSSGKSGSLNVHFYSRMGACTNYTTSSSGWTEHFNGSTSVTRFAGRESLFMCPLQAPITVRNGQSVSFYMHSDDGDGIHYASSDGAESEVDLKNDHLVLNTGYYFESGSTPFSGVNSSTRRYRGAVEYELL